MPRVPGCSCRPGHLVTRTVNRARMTEPFNSRIRRRPTRYHRIGADRRLAGARRWVKQAPDRYKVRGGGGGGRSSDHITPR